MDTVDRLCPIYTSKSLSTTLPSPREALSVPSFFLFHGHFPSIMPSILLTWNLRIKPFSSLLALLSVYEERFLEQYSFSLAINPVFHGYSPSRDSRKLALGLRQSNELFVPESPCFSPKATTAPDLAGTTHSNMLPRKKKKMGQFKLS